METALLERESSGIHVKILFEPNTKALSLSLTEGESDPFFAILEPGQVRDAFDHPYCYLSREDLEVSQARTRELVLA